MYNGEKHQNSNSNFKIDFKAEKINSIFISNIKDSEYFFENDFKRDIRWAVDHIYRVCGIYHSFFSIFKYRIGFFYFHVREKVLRSIRVAIRALDYIDRRARAL